MRPQHTGAWGQTMIEALVEQGFSIHQIAGNTGINIKALEGSQPKIDFDQLALLFERAEELTGDDLVGFKHGQTSDYRRGGLIAYTGASSPTVRTLLQNLARYQRVTGDAIKINLDRLNEQGVLEWHFQVPRGVRRRQYVEFGGAGVIDTIRRLTNCRVYPERVEFKHFRKKNLKVFSHYFGCSVDFGKEENRITLKLKDLNLPLSSADGYLYDLLRQFCDDALSEVGQQKPAIVSSVEECISADPTKSQAIVAHQLGLSTRTLARRLAESGTTFMSVVEAYRKAMAKSMLSETDMQLTQIAYVLGYSDSSAFSTAFKRWFGKTPTQYRTEESIKSN